MLVTSYTDSYTLVTRYLNEIQLVILIVTNVTNILI